MKKVNYIIFQLLKKKKNNEINMDIIMLFYSFFSIMQIVMYIDFLLFCIYFLINKIYF